MSLISEPRIAPQCAQSAAQPNVRPVPIPAAQRTDRRGPMRPGRLIASRARLNGRLLSSTFRIVDLATAGVLAWFASDVANPGGNSGGPVSTPALFAFGVGLLAVFLQAVGAYRLRPRERVAGHLARIALAFALAAAMVAGTLALARAAGALWNAEAIWFGLAFASLYLLHVWWWFSARRLRHAGRLTRNVVIVGATDEAARLIESALAHREVSVLGVFDDRLTRSPPSVRGVPVLGNTEALLSHRITPFVDRVVIAVPADARARVRGLVDRLRELPNEITVSFDYAGEDIRDDMRSRVVDLPLALTSGAQRTVMRRALPSVS